jgi:hypothetical protein
VRRGLRVVPRVDVLAEHLIDVLGGDGVLIIRKAGEPAARQDRQVVPPDEAGHAEHGEAEQDELPP